MDSFSIYQEEEKLFEQQKKWTKTFKYIKFKNLKKVIDKISIIDQIKVQDFLVTSYLGRGTIVRRL